MTPPPTDKDHEHAAFILDQIKRMRDIGEFIAQDTRQGEIHFVACMLRNERDGAIIKGERYGETGTLLDRGGK